MVLLHLLDGLAGWVVLVESVEERRRDDEQKDAGFDSDHILLMSVDLLKQSARGFLSKFGSEPLLVHQSGCELVLVFHSNFC